jgi:AcrR family transcriptional regulator
MSKTGLYGHFGSKERLQLETVAIGREIFRRHVIAPAEKAPAGLPRLWALCTAYFEIEALLVAGNHVYHLDNDPQALELARAGIARRLEDLRTPGAPALADWSTPEHGRQEQAQSLERR